MRVPLEARMPKHLVVLSSILSLAGCAQHHWNAPLAKYDAHSGYRFRPEPSQANSNSLFVCLTFSGGGMRAAALSYGVLKELAERKITWPPDGKQVRLLDEVDLISAVSGGAFTAAYYRLFGERIFEDFGSRVLYRNLQGELTRSLFKPSNWFRMMSWWFDRVDLAAELYNKTVFEQKTFADIDPRKPRPFVVINATNMATGSQFQFTQDQFDLLGSDLGTYPVGNAVAASSAVPVIFSPVTLRNYSAPKNYLLPSWIRRALDDPLASPQQRLRASGLARYHLEKPNHPYLHLIDGAISDNLGLSVVLDEFRQGYIQRLCHGMQMDRDSPIDRIQKLLLIVVNSRSKLDETIDRSSTSPGIFDMAYYAGAATMDQHSFALMEIVQESLKVSRKAQAALDDVGRLLNRISGAPQFPKFQKFQVYLVEVNPEHIEDSRQREALLNIPANLRLQRNEVQRLIWAAGELLRKSSEFQRFFRELAGA